MLRSGELLACALDSQHRSVIPGISTQAQNIEIPMGQKKDAFTKYMHGSLLCREKRWNCTRKRSWACHMLASMFCYMPFCTQVTFSSHPTLPRITLSANHSLKTVSCFLWLLFCLFVYTTWVCMYCFMFCLHSLIEMNSFDQLLRDSNTHLRRLSRGLLFFNEWSDTATNAERYWRQCSVSSVDDCWASMNKVPRQ